jgi:dTDP-4-amino-4,6-dideoxy-D-galactose acyltransferase
MDPLTVEPVQGVPSHLDRLLAAWAFKPHRWGLPENSPGLLQLALERVGNSLHRPDVDTWAAWRAGTLCGVILLEPLDWDSRLLSTPAARLELIVASEYREGRRAAGALIDAARAGARMRDFRHISARVDAADDAAVHALESSHFVSVDALMTFGAPMDDLTAVDQDAGVAVRLASDTDAAAVGEIAATAFRYSRFHSDPAITPEQAAKVHRTWAANCCCGSAADAVIVATRSDQPIGFIACRLQRDTGVHLQRLTGTIPLIALSDADAGRGIGATLVGAAVRWFRSEGARSVEVGTQLRNIRAARLYERCGLRLVAGSLSFRTVLNA